MSNITHKAIINQKYGSKAKYRTEEVPNEAAENAQSSQPGQKKYKCCLELPELKHLGLTELSVTSGVFTRKKDAEQDAAKQAIEQLEIDAPSNKPLTDEEKWQALKDHLCRRFTEQFVGHCPLIAHFKAAVQREGEKNGLVPAAALYAFDSKIASLCKSIKSEAEVDPALSLEVVLKAAKSCAQLESPLDSLWIGKRGPFSSKPKENTGNIDGNIECRESTESSLLEVVYIPCSIEKSVESLTLKIEPHEYFMDVIASHLRVRDSSHMLISRVLKKGPSESRLYFPVPDSLSLVPDLDGSSFICHTHGGRTHYQLKFNSRASSLVGQKIHGDAILAAVGTTWKLYETLWWENINLSKFNRLLLLQTPRGSYKISRNAVLVAELPTTFTTCSHWHGTLPRELLINFCHHYGLSEPIFSDTDDTTLQADSKAEHQNSKRRKQSESYNLNYNIQNGESNNNAKSGGAFICAVKILSKAGQLMFECVSEHSYRNKNDAKQSAALKALHDKYIAAVHSRGVSLGSEPVSPEISNHVSEKNLNKECGLEFPFVALCISEDPDLGKSHSSGTIACISYRVNLLDESVNERLEEGEDFEFEIGTGAVIPQLEECVAQLSVNESKTFHTALPSMKEILAAADKTAGKISNLPLGRSYLEYSVKLLKLIEPLEERIERALFSPLLSKQRIEYALRLLADNHAKTLVDLGCGSGSLFDALLDKETGLVQIIGVDISEKCLARASKILGKKLGIDSQPASSMSSIQKVVLYKASITEADPRLHGFDLATCIEVIEHIEEAQAFKIGDCVLGMMCPRIFMVSTPNYEYNPVIQRMALDQKIDCGGEESALDAEGKDDLPYRFRNGDHKFEWTRKQFIDWAETLAPKYGYTVEFSGVGGSGDIEPGFASQIAVFKRCPAFEESSGSVRKRKCCQEVEAEYAEEFWKWDADKRVSEDKMVIEN